MQPSWTQPGRRMVEGAIRGFLAEALLPLTGLITAAFLTRRLGPARYGVFTLAATLVTGIEGNLVTVFTRATFKFIAEAEDWQPIGTAVVQLHLNQTTKDWHPKAVTLSETKGLIARFFASLRMTGLSGHVVKCTNVMCFDLVAGGCVMVLLWLCAAPIAALFNEPRLATYLRLFALDIPIFSLARAHQNLLIGLSFLLLGEFSADEIALARSLGYWRSTSARASGEV